jgi:tripartite-type tricarboxylate transporter receptor subunit TctC
MRTFIHLSLGAVAATALAAGTVAGPAHAVDFSGKRIEWIIPYPTGGGSDRWARFFAPRLSKHLEGQPVVAVKNMPGGNSTTGTNYFARRAKPDGLMIIGTSGSTQFPYLLGDRRVQYEYKDWIVVMATPTGGVAYISSKYGVKSAADLKTMKGKLVKFGSQGATSLDLVPALAWDILGLNSQVVFGFKGRGPVRLAFERGETTIDYQTTSAYLKNVMPLVKAGKAVPLMSWGTIDENGKLVRDPTFPELPTLIEAYRIVHGKDPKGPAWNAWVAFFTAGFAAQKMIFLPKGTPKDIVDTYRKAISSMLKEPGFEQAMEKALGKYPQAEGKKSETLAKLATDVSPKSKEWVIGWLKRRFNVTP